MTEPKRSKYGNVPTTINGITFDSKKEASRYQDLLLLLQNGYITNLKLQPCFTLQESFKTAGGTTVRSLVYRADFSYIRPAEEGELPNAPSQDGIPMRWVVEDVKGGRATQTPEFRMKAKLFAEKYGFPVTII